MTIDKPLNILPGELRCPRCFGKDIVPSMPRGWRDAVMLMLDRIPRHCRFCECRFYIRRPTGEESSGTPQNQAHQ